MGQITPGQTAKYGAHTAAAAAGSYVGHDLPFVLCTQDAESQLKFSKIRLEYTFHSNFGRYNDKDSEF